MSKTLWLTGLPAAGKSTLARETLQSLNQRGLAGKIIDGDELRKGLSSDLGYSRSDRRENIRRAAEVCRMLNASGIIAIAALVSPYREDREAARHVIGSAAFFEVWLAAPLAVCEQRDPKGLYRRARAGEVREFTGISDPYEPPLAPQLTLDTHLLDRFDCVAKIEALLGLE